MPKARIKQRDGALFGTTSILDVASIFYDFYNYSLIVVYKGHIFYITILVSVTMHCCVQTGVMCRMQG
jgi:hypothetical protein